MEEKKCSDCFSVLSGEADLQGSSGALDTAGQNHPPLIELLDVMDIAMWEFDLDYRVVNCNQKAKRIYGEDILGKFCYWAAAKRDTICEDCPAKKVYEGHDSGRSEHQRIKPSGEKIYIDHIATAIKDFKGNLTGVLVLIIDITRHKLLEEELKRHRDALEEMVVERTRELVDSEERYRSVMAAAPDPVVVYDNDGNVNFINPAFTRIFGWTFKEIHGKRIDFIPLENAKETRDAIKEVLETGFCLGFDTRRYTKNGDILDVNINAANYYDSDGKSRGIVVNLRDITDWKRTNMVMVQTEKMMSLGGLAAGMAHEINNPLSGILQNAQVAVNRVTKDLPANRKAADEVGISLEKINAYLEKRSVINMLFSIREAGRRAAEIVDDMLSFSRNRESKRAPNDIAGLVDKAIGLAKKNYDVEKGYDFNKIEVVRRFEDDLPMIPCEETKIQQVILNILKNGVQAMAAVGTENPRFIIRCRRDGNYVRIEIHNNGPDMEEAVAKRIFEPFFTTKPEGEGTGLGLSVSYYIISENHGGTLEVDSRPGKGTNFIICLPIE